MKRRYLTVLVGLCLAMPFAIQGVAGDASDKPLQGEISIGGKWQLDDLDKHEGRAKGGAEFDSTADKNLSWDTGAKLDYRSNSINFDVDARYRDGDDQTYGGNLDLSRILLYKTNYDRFMHRLGHDYMDNLTAHIFRAAGTPGAPAGLPFPCPDPNNPAFCQALPDTDPNTAGYQNARSTIGAAAVYHTDHDPFATYGNTHTTWENSLTFNIPQMPGLQVGFDHRQEKRKGCAQAMTTSKCSACHIESYSKGINEETNDYIPRVSLKIEALALEYSFMHREFNDKSQEMINGYNTLAAAHIAPFAANLQFPTYSGTTLNAGSEILPFSRTPDSTKDSHTLKGRYDIDANNTVMAGLVYSKSTNTQTDGAYAPLYGEFGRDLELDSTAMLAKWHSRLSHAVSLNLFGKYQTMNNDNVGIDVNDAALHNKYKNEPADLWDFTRQSAYDMDILTLGADLSWKLAKGITLKGGYEYKMDDRKNADLLNVPETTDEHTIKLSADWRVNRQMKWAVGYKGQFVSHPYAYKNAVCTPWSSFGQYAGPASDGADYYRSYGPNIYDARTGTRSNLPNQAHEFSLKGNFMPMKMLSANVYGKYKNARNDDVSGNDWQQDLFTGGLNLVLTPSEKLVFTAGYNYFYDTYDSMYCIAIYDG